MHSQEVVVSHILSHTLDSHCQPADKITMGTLIFGNHSPSLLLVGPILYDSLVYIYDYHRPEVVHTHSHKTRPFSQHTAESQLCGRQHIQLLFSDDMGDTDL